MKSLLKEIQYDMLDIIEGEDDAAYSSNDVTECIKLLLEFWGSFDAGEQNAETANLHTKQLVHALKELNQDCSNSLIDEEQSKAINEFIEKTLLTANIAITGNISQL